MRDGDEGEAVPARAELQRFLDDAAIASAGRSRTRRRWLTQQTVEESTFVGALRDLVEQSASAAVATVAGRMVRGRLRAVGRDVVVVDAGAQRHLIVVGAIAEVRPTGRGRGPRGTPAASAATLGSRGPTHDVTLREILTAFCPDRPDVVVYQRVWSTGRAGRLAGVGLDVLSLVGGGAERPQVLLPYGSVSEVVI